MELAQERTLFPLLSTAGLANLERIIQHPCAPTWTHRIGDHLVASDLAEIAAFRQRCANPVPARGGRRPLPAPDGGPPPGIVEWVARLRDSVPAFRQRIPLGYALERDWSWLPTTRREDLALHPEDFVPLGESLERLIVYDTSGTTGHALRVPHHPRAVALLHVLAERALMWHGQEVARGAGAVACMNLCAQASVWVYPSVFSVWEDAGFARVNLNERAWPGGRDHARRFIGQLAPGFLSGNPASFAEALHWGIEASPKALLSTAFALSEPLRDALSAHFRCPVLDWYSTTETGPVACSKPGAPGLALLAPDLYVELVDEEGQPVPEGERGEVTVSGGRNPYLPLLRYRTGDFARFTRHPNDRGELEPRLTELEGRASVVFRGDHGRPVNPVDVGRALRNHVAVVQHCFVQHADGSLTATLRLTSGLPVDLGGVEAELRALFGPGTRLAVVLDSDLGRDGKLVPYRCELPDVLSGGRSEGRA